MEARLPKPSLAVTVMEKAAPAETDGGPDREKEPGRTTTDLEEESEVEPESWTEMVREPVEKKVTEKEWEPSSEAEKE